MLEQLGDTLKPLLDVTELLGGDKYVTWSVLIPPLKLLKNAIKTNGCDPAFICRFKAILVDSAEERLLAWPHYSDYEVATSLDSRFKSLACIGRDRRGHMWERLSQLATKLSATPTEIPLAESESTILWPKVKSNAHLARCRYTSLWQK
ncbi:hypothetical protein HPB48_019603 [Haemaphysalis longicornis]|uniref:Uncharacterized protein n=1 Tax=Haemaphysalis longicornis TaxID=44386 RepID=A0A9J6FF28_HAELO|nr:hypothetical protein HPB48_019603 [Haemaphysalis longicornis]